MRRAPARAAALLAAAWILAGCGSGGEGGGAGGAPSGPTLVPVDSVRLAESDSIYIGKPSEPYVDPFDGTFYVTDIFSKTVYRFARDGRLLRTYGRPGQGPGELQSPATVVIPDDSTVAVVDQRHQKLLFFDRETGAFRRERRLAGMASVASVPLVLGDSVWLSLMRFDIRKALVRFEMRSDSSEWIGRLPGIIQTSLDEGPGRYAQFYTWMGYLADTDRHLLQGFRALSWIYVRDRAGAVLDSVYVPSVRRLGVPGDFREKLDEEKLELLDALEAASALFDLHALPDGAVALEHQDWTLLSRDVIPPPPVAKVWISLLSPDLERACIDAKLSDPGDAYPVVAFRGDTVFQLDRRIVGGDQEGEGAKGSSSRPALETWLRIVRIDPSGCDWIPARPPEG